MSINLQGNAILPSTWTVFKSNTITGNKSLPIQYHDDGYIYTVFAFDDDICYTCTIWKSTVPDGIINGGYSQSQNDSDKSDFENNYKSTANSRLTSSADQVSVLSNDTITVGASKTFAGFNNRQINLFINVKNAPTGTGPGLQFTIQEVDPGDLSTSIGTTVTGASITAAGTQEISLNLTTSSAIKVSWIIVGSNSPTFTGVYATLTSKPTTVFSGVDVGGTERVMQPDTSGRLMVVGSTAIGAAVVGNPVMMGGSNTGGVAGYIALASDNSTIVSQGVNKQPIFVNGTITSGSISNISGLGVPMVSLFINIKNTPTGTNPSVIFSMYEIDPGDQATVIGTTITGSPITAIGTQILTLPLTTSGMVQVSWTVAGTSPSFTGVYVTALMKDANMITGPSTIGTKMIGNPIINGAVDSLGNVQALSSKLINGLMNMMVYDEQMSNKLDQIILILTDIRDREVLGE